MVRVQDRAIALVTGNRSIMIALGTSDTLVPIQATRTKKPA
jgi:hypothetical protein